MPSLPYATLHRRRHRRRSNTWLVSSTASIFVHLERAYAKGRCRLCSPHPHDDLRSAAGNIRSALAMLADGADVANAATAGKRGEALIHKSHSASLGEL